ncbi:MAG: hypothetical protein ACK501_10640 [Planctomycetota bacterium]|jgi:hypothetical protein
MHDSPRTPPWSDTLLPLAGTGVFFLPFALVFLLVFGGGLGANSEPEDPFDPAPAESFAPEPPSTSDLFPVLCALGVVVPMAIAVRIVVRHRA